MLAGMVYAAPDTKYMQVLAPFLAKKKALAADAWGADSKRVAGIFEPLEKWMTEMVSGCQDTR